MKVINNYKRFIYDIEHKRSPYLGVYHSVLYLFRQGSTFLLKRLFFIIKINKYSTFFLTCALSLQRHCPFAVC